MDIREMFERDCARTREYDTERHSDGSYVWLSTIYAWKGYQAGHAAAADEIAELRAKVEAAEKDAARYRWLRTFPNNINPSVYGITVTKDSGLLRRDEYLDAAIDAARGK